MPTTVDVSSIGSFAPIQISWGAQSQPSHQGASGPAALESLSMEKHIDEFSPLLLQALAKGTALKGLTITFTGATPGTATFNSIAVISMDLNWSADQDPREAVAFQFQSFTYTVGQNTATWDLPKS